MGKKWLLRLPKDLDDWLTLRAAQETVSRGKKISKNTLIIELVTTFKHADLPDPEAELTGGESWQDAKSALEFIQKTIELKAEEGSGVSDRIKQRMLVNLELLRSYIEDLED
ncbi:MAG: hypothetical protein P8075_01905 [Deltaproteobacteria bacterium]|jgi:hypothetical protein